MKDYVVETEIGRVLTDQDVHEVGKQLDDAMHGLATGTLSRDEATLAYLTLVESVFYILGWRHIDHDALVLPALDQIITCYPDDRKADTPSQEALKVARVWLQPSSDYHDLVGGIINALKGRMTAVETRSGCFAFFPRSSLAAELRNRWFARRVHAAHEAAGRHILDRSSETLDVLRRLDRWVESQQEAMGQGSFVPPAHEWYVSHVSGIADRTLQAQFAHVTGSERIASLSKAETLAAIRPLFVRAARLLFGHLRAFKYLREQVGAPSPVLLSCIDVVSKADLVQEIVTSAQISHAAALKFVNSLVRTGREEKYGLKAYPLVPISGDRVVVLPSTILFGAWPLMRERTEAKTRGDRIGRTRDKRHIEQLEAAFRAAGFQHVFTDVQVKLSASQTLTDLDIAVVLPTTGDVLVVQAKSFLPPSNLLDVERATDDVRDADRQCDTAAAHPVLTKQAIESKLGTTLPAFQLHQLIVVEAIVGTYEPKAPAVSIEWLLDTLSTRPRVTFHELVETARALPDGRAFFDSVSPTFQLFREGFTRLAPPRPCAVFAYGAADAP